MTPPSAPPPDTDHQDNILRQYDSPQGLHFYRTVMGDGGLGIHYGLYRDPNDSMRRASQETMAEMVRLATALFGPMQGKKIVDLGSGMGHSAHYLAQHHSAHITCVNLGVDQHRINREEAQRLGLSAQIETAVANFEALPEEWRGRFDVVWSQEAFCHAQNKRQVLQEAARVLKAGGGLVFTDIMGGSAPTEKGLNSFSDRNAVSNLATVPEYLQWLDECGFQQVSYLDFTEQLPLNFQKMIQQIDQNHQALLQQGVQEDYLLDFRRSLNQRIEHTREGTFSWGCFTARKGETPTSAEGSEAP